MIEFTTKSAALEKQRAGCLVIGVFEDGKLTQAGETIDRVSKGHLKGLVQRGDVTGKLNTTVLLFAVPGVAAERVLLIGLGKEKDFKEKEYRQVLQTVVKTLQKTGAEDVVISLVGEKVAKRDLAWRIAQAVQMASEATYRFDQLKSKKSEAKQALSKLIFMVERGDAAAADQAIAEALAIAHGVKLAKDLGNLPGNHCTPTYLAQQAQQLAKEFGFKVQILEQAECEKLGMGSFLAVSRASAEPPKFIVLEYKGSKASKTPYVLVGKGITFDTGGISLKPPPEMDELKFDMCGAASVLGTFRALGELKPKLHVVGLIPTCENMPGGRAIKPGDIVKSMSGQTIEILNTDAEGRLILADALTYAERYKPAAVIDIATLTGACVIALGHIVAGLFANNDRLAKELVAAGEAAHDRAWPMPLWEEYQDALDSNFADIANVGGRAGGSITAACFLSRFTKEYPWAHLDIAGVAHKSGKDKGATGRPVSLLVHYLLGQET